MASPRTRFGLHVRLGRCAAFVGLAALVAAAALGGCAGEGTAPSGTGEAGGETPAADRMVRLERGAHPLARPELDVRPRSTRAGESRTSRSSSSSRPQQLRDRDALMAAQLDPSSPSYHQWLTPEEYAARFGARPDDIARASRLARAARARGPPRRLAPRRARHLLRTRVHARVGVPHRDARATSSPARRTTRWPRPRRFPPSCADVVLGVHNTHDFYAAPAQSTRARGPARPTARVPATRTAAATASRRPDWATVYDVDSALHHRHRRRRHRRRRRAPSPSSASRRSRRATSTRSAPRYGLPASTVTMTLVPDTGAAARRQRRGDRSHPRHRVVRRHRARARRSSTSTPAPTTGNVDDATFYAIEHNLAADHQRELRRLRSTARPRATRTSLEIFGSAANLLGITYLAASGDSGAAGCLRLGIAGLYVYMPASLPRRDRRRRAREFPTGSSPTTRSGNATGYSTEEAVWNEANNPLAGGRRRRRAAASAPSSADPPTRAPSPRAPSSARFRPG